MFSRKKYLKFCHFITEFLLFSSIFNFAMITKKKILQNIVLDFPGITPRSNMEAFKSVVSLYLRTELGLQSDMLENSYFVRFVQTYCSRVSTLSKKKGGLKSLLNSNNHLEFFSTEITIELVLNQPAPPPPWVCLLHL